MGFNCFIKPDGFMLTPDYPNMKPNRRRGERIRRFNESLFQNLAFTVRTLRALLQNIIVMLGPHAYGSPNRARRRALGDSPVANSSRIRRDAGRHRNWS